MFKIVSTELKKIVSKPGIYILSVLLAIVLVLGVFIYKPVVHESANFELKGVTYIEKYTDFTGNDHSNAGKKAEAQINLDKSIQSIENYFIVYQDETLSQKEYIDTLLKKCEELYDAYLDCSSDNSYQEQINSIRDKLVTSLENLNDAVENAFINSQYGSYSILSSKNNYNSYKSIYKQVISWAKITVEKNNLTEHFMKFEKQYKDEFYSTLNNFKYPTLSDNFVSTYTTTGSKTKLSTLNSRLNTIELEIQKHYDLSSSDTEYNSKHADKMDELANLYSDTVNVYVNLIKYELLNHAFSYLSTNEELTTLYLSDYLAYNSKSLLVRYDYLFDHNKTMSDYANPLTIGVTSENKINAYDYSYFTLKVFSFIIIVYAIMAACHSIAGEIKEGSMRYLAIRPTSRKELFLGKWFSILIISLLLILFSAIISICVGIAVYGVNSQTILTIFNGTTAITIHPLGMIGVYLVSMMFELIIYSLLAMLFSVLFKSDLMSMTILLVLYLLNTIVPIFVQGVNSWLAYYPFSHISLYSLFGSSVYSTSNNFFNLVFGAKVYAGTHFALTISIILLTIILVSFIAIKIFKKKEL